jgi:hypothetical protein
VAPEEKEEDAHVTTMPSKALKLYAGSPTRFDLNEYKDSFYLLHQ